VKLMLNARPYRPANVPETWAEWLDGLDAEAATTGRIVTAVRFDGVDEPAFRAPAARTRRLSLFEEVEVDTATPLALILRTVTEAADMSTSLAAAAASVAEAFRELDISEGHDMLPQLVHGMQHIVTLTDACATALGIGTHAITCEGVPFNQWMAEFGRRLIVLLEAEARHDWPTVADCLEYEMEPALRAWSTIFEQLATAAHNTAA
jgi:hypothetical protein